MPAYSDFIAAYPEFAGVPEAQGKRQLGLGVKLWSPGVVGNFHDEMVYLWTAHYLALRFNIADGLESSGVNPEMTGSGTVSSMSASVGSLSITNANSAMVSSDNAFEADMSRTRYGLEFLSLLDMVVGPGRVVISPELP